jgi:hypothetical protein
MHPQKSGAKIPVGKQGAKEVVRNTQKYFERSMS